MRPIQIRILVLKTHTGKILLQESEESTDDRKPISSHISYIPTHKGLAQLEVRFSCIPALHCSRANERQSLQNMTKYNFALTLFLSLL